MDNIITCKVCNGRGYLETDGIYVTRKACPSCKGTGIDADQFDDIAHMYTRDKKDMLEFFKKNPKKSAPMKREAFREEQRNLICRKCGASVSYRPDQVDYVCENRHILMIHETAPPSQRKKYLKDEDENTGSWDQLETEIVEEGEWEDE